MKVFDSIFLAVGVVIAAEATAAAAANAVTTSTEIMDITTSNPVIVDLSKDFEISNSFNDSPGMDMVNELAASWPNTRVVTVIQHGKIVGEYVRDDDVDPNQLHRVWSATKTVSGMLFGILVDQYGTSINTTLGELFPNEIDWNLVDNESTVDYMKSLSAYEILTMTTGLEENPCMYNGNCTSTLGGGDLQSTLAWPIINKEGERGAWEYMTFWNILSYITREVTDLTPRELLAAKILPAIGIEDTDIEWPLEHLGGSIDVQQGTAGLELTTKQMAKIGQLIIQKGLAAPEGTQILSYEWIKTSLFPHTPVPATSWIGRETMYGYQWYSEKSEEFGDSYTAIGATGQFIVVHPQSGIVLAIQSDDSLDSTYDPEFDCGGCDWFFPLLNEGPDFFITADYTPNPQQNLRDERPCLADCKMEESCMPQVPPSKVEVCAEAEVCTFEVGRDELSSELGYFEFKGVGGATCPGGTNPVLGIKKGATYLFTQRRTGNYYHPLGFAYGADGALDEQPELEPGICPGTVKGEEDTTDCDCKEKGLCPAPMYYTSNNYLGEYSNNPYLAPIKQSEDFGLDAYEPQFFYPLLQWKGTPKEEDPTGPGYYQVALHFPEDTEYTGDFFYFCHIHQYMTGRFKFVDEAGLSISPDNTLRIPYEYQEPDAYDRSCGATGIGESQLPDMECPSTFVCDAPDAAVAPFAAKFAECVDSMNCAMLKGITTKISSDSPIALFNHQMIPHHQQAVNMCKALDVAQGTECEDIFDEDKPECVLKVLCQEIINVQNAQIQTMRGILAQLNYPDTDNCIVDIPVDPQTACEANSGSTGYSWCVLTQTCVPPGDDECLEASCEENSIVTGKHWCALTRTCFEQGDQSCDKAYCELDSGSTGFLWCELTGTCVAPGDDACLEAVCEENSASTGYHWCALTQTCFPPGDTACDQAHCELVIGPSTGYSWCEVLEKCLPPSDTCALPTGPPAPTDPVATFAPTAMATFSPTVMPTRSSTSKSSKSSKSRRQRRN